MADPIDSAPQIDVTAESRVKRTRLYAFITSPSGISIALIVVSIALITPLLLIIPDSLNSSPLRLAFFGAAALVVAFVASLPHLLDPNRVLRIMKVAGSVLFVGLFIAGAAAVPLVIKHLPVLIPVFALLAIAFFSFLPSWLYFQFVFRRSKTIWQEYVLNLYRLKMDHPAALPEPPRASAYYGAWARGRRETRLEGEPERADNLYRHKFEAQFGIARTGNVGVPVVKGESLFPVAIATILISAGWLLVVLNETHITHDDTPAAETQATGAAPVVAPAAPTTASSEQAAPHEQEHPFPLETIAFGFLGAYCYTLQMLVRRFFQNDLKSVAYITATMRIVVVALLVWVIHLVPPAGSGDETQQIIAAFAFVVGIFPDVGWQALQSVIKAPMKVLVPSLRQPYPLSDLDGLNPFYESRLLEEGIEDMQNLATANLVDVMLNTRIPVERMVDWVDQALLYLHLPVSAADKDLPSPRDRLRAFGIRTATDLADGFASKDKAFVAGLERLLNQNDQEPSATRSVLATLRREPNLYHIEQWKTHCVPEWVSPQVETEPAAEPQPLTASPPTVVLALPG